MIQPDDRIIEAVKGAHAITWDKCHKIYISADAETTEEFKEWDYSITLIPQPFKPEVDAAETLQGWYDDSCPLRFISKVSKRRSPDSDPEFESVISQFDDEED